MNLLYGAYILMSSGLLITCLPPFYLYTLISGKYRDRMKERLGYISPGLVRSISGSPRIWLHAVSLGEVRVAGPIVHALKKIMPDCFIVLSATTEHGRDLAVDILGGEVPVIYGPADSIFSVRKALHAVRPDVLAFLETEIWPSWINEASRMGINISIVNGRISKRSLKRYLKLRPFFQKILDKVDVFSMITEEDRSRIISIGANPQKILVNGNAKYDLLPDLADPSIEAEMRKTLNLEASSKVFIAGSTRSGEESMVIDAYKKILEKFPDTVLLIAPRHIERTREIGSLLERHGFRYQLRSEIDPQDQKRVEKIVIINTFGELFKLYSIGTIIFCGASLVPLGGQNPLEAAVWGKAVIYGPHMDDFLDAKALLEEKNAGILVSGPEMLAEKAIELLRDPDLLKKRGMDAREAVFGNHDSAGKHAEAIAGLIYKDAFSRGDSC